MGGTDDPSNLVELTIKEHAEAHKKLYKKYGRWQDKLAYESLLKLKPRHQITKEIQRRTGLMSKGRKLSEQAKKNISEGMKGLKRSEKTKMKTSNTLSKEWIIITPNGKKFEVKNLHTFCKKNDLNSGNMSRVAKGIFSHHKGYKVSYKY